MTDLHTREQNSSVLIGCAFVCMWLFFALCSVVVPIGILGFIIWVVLKTMTHFGII